MTANPVPESKPLEAAVESPAEAMQAQMLLLKQAHHGEGVNIDASDKMEANRISGLPLGEQLAAFTEWAIKLAAEGRRKLQEEITSNTRKQIEQATLLKGKEDEIIRLKGLLRFDSLTETLSRRILEEELENKIKEIDGGREKGRRAEEMESMSILFLDLDHFKQINDTLGHEVGDAVLEEFSQLIRENIRNDDLIGRIGGEEFIVILADTDGENGERKAEKLREVTEKQLKTRILKRFPQHEKKIKTLDGTTSVGVTDYSVANNKKLTSKELVKEADQAMYHSKNNGRNRVTFYDPEIIEELDKKMADKENTEIESER